jgi:hypothetical protein
LESLIKIAVLIGVRFYKDKKSRHKCRLLNSEKNLIIQQLQQVQLLQQQVQLLQQQVQLIQ